MLNRLSWLRPSSTFLNSAAESDEARWVVLCHGQPLVDSSTNTLALLPTSALRHLLGPRPFFGQTQNIEDVGDAKIKALAASRLRGPPVVFLGWRETDPEATYRHPSVAADLPGTPFFAVEFGSPNHEVSGILPNSRFINARKASASFDEFENVLFSTASSILDWNSRMKFCPSCGHPSHSIWGGWRRCCSTQLPWARSAGEKPCPSMQGLHNTEFPRTDPVVIVAVTSLDGERILLGRNKKYSTPYYSLIAGFMEPGESAEQAAARELWEEAGVRADSVRVAQTQPWPHPANLMLGCRASADASQQPRTDIDDELADAKWFSREEVLAVLAHPRGTNVLGRDARPDDVADPANDSDDPPFYLPGTSAVSGRLISDWAYRRE
ncbi:hypothetical protein AURDEDRAFT_88728 [Auricularia subglabra TFB-10046 SS5]|nr:hypothetical protein AURDEDRAFT_88728 [Auricularia subglabra TFB-10046 SS5]